MSFGPGPSVIGTLFANANNGRASLIADDPSAPGSCDCGTGGGNGGGGAGGISFTDDQGVAAQPFPTNYRVDLLAFFKS